MADSRYRLLIEIDAKGGASVKVLDNVAKSLGNVEKASKQASLGQKILTGAFEQLGRRATNFAMQIPRMTVELTKLGASVQAADRRLASFAGGAEQATDYLKALQIGSDYTIDRLTALQQASRMLETGMARNTREMELAGAMVAKLGNQTRSTESRMQMLTLLLANQSKLRLDEFGLSIENVTRRQKELEKQGLSTEAAFRGAVFAEAEHKLGILGETSDLTAVAIERVTAAWNTLKQTFGEALAVSVGTDTLNKVADALNRIGSEYMEHVEGIEKARGLGLKRQDFDQYVFAYHEAAKAASVWQQDEDELRASLEAKNAALRESTVQTATYTQAMVDSLSALGMTGQATQDYVTELWQTHYAADGFTEAVQGGSSALIEQSYAAYSASTALMDLASAYASYSQQMSYGYADYAGSMADIEAQYQRSVESIESMGGGGGGGGGGAPEREFDRADIERGLKIGRLQLEEYEKQRADFDKVDAAEPVFWYELSRQDRKYLMESGKTLDDLALERRDKAQETSELERAQMDDRIEDLKKELSETTRILEQGHWDRHEMRVAAAQRDTSAMLEEAKRRRDQQITALEKQQAREEEMHMQSLGRIKLMAFDSWVERNKDSLLKSEESRAIVEKMRQDIMLQYGLLTQEAIDETARWENSFEKMFTSMKLDAQEGVTELDKVLQKLNELPDEKVIKIRYELANRPEDIARQHGGGVKAGSPYIVGEAGPELFVPGSSGTVINNRRTEQIVGSHNTYNINDTRAMAFLAANERARARTAFAEASGM